MKRENYPIYLAGIQFYLACENQSFARTLEKTELSHTERSLLMARKHFSQGQFLAALELLSSLTPESDFLSGEKSLLMATAHSNLGDSESAFLFNTRAIEAYRKAEDQRGHFISTYNLSVDAGLLGLKKVSHDLLEKARPLAVTLEERLLIIRAHACALSAERKYQMALGEIRRALALCEEEKTESTNILDILTLKVVATDILFRAGDLNGALKLLESIRHEKLLKPKARVFFNLSLLTYIKTGQLGLKPARVMESLEHSLKWDIIHHLVSGDLTLARKSWSELVKSFPNTYEEDFKAKSLYDEESIFFACLRSIESKIAKLNPVAFPKGSKLDVLHSCLASSRTPLRKEELIERIWKTPYDPSFDTRFYKLVQRLKDSSLPIANEKRAYFYKSS